GTGVDVVQTESGQCGRDLAIAPSRIGFCPAGGVDGAEGGKRLAGGGAQFHGGRGQSWVHDRLPTRARATIVRCPSMVPGATVAACAYRQWSSTAPCSGASNP